MAFERVGVYRLSMSQYQPIAARADLPSSSLPDCGYAED
jgi:hypothetical protein